MAPMIHIKTNISQDRALDIQAKSTIDLTQDDELDLISATTASTPTRVADPSPDLLKSNDDGKATIRARRSMGLVSYTQTNHNKRARAISISVIENDGGRKKQKMDNKKANTIVIIAKRIQLDAARRRWLHRHRDLFLPLLPASTFFDNLKNEIEESGEKASYIPFHALDEQPKLIQGGTMKEYQLQGLAFLVYMHNNGMNCILGDEMGLGKTLQTLSLFAHVRENTKGIIVSRFSIFDFLNQFIGKQDPHLIICPLSVLSSWQNEVARWLPSLRTLRFHGTQSERDRLKNSMRGVEIPFDLCITTYEAFVAEDSWFKSRRWMYCVLDEGHRIKNSDTNLASKVQGIGALHRLILTGTPVQNNLVELWGLLHWLYPTVFTAPSERRFKESFDLSRGSYSIPFLKAAQELLAVIMIRRTKANVDINVPPREELTVFIPMTEAQRFWTYRLLTRMDTLDLKQIFISKLEDGPLDDGRREVLSHIASQINRSSSGEANQWRKLMNLLMQLRKVCDHPYLLKDASPSPYQIGEHIVASSSKLIVIDKILADVLPKGERVLIFTQWTRQAKRLALRAIPYARLDGETNRPRRALNIKLFQQEKSPYQVFLISTKAGGLGINLTKASTVIMCDSDWNPQNDLQAIARAHRIGQTKVVQVYRLICQGSVEDQMLDRIRRKLFLSIKIMSSSETSSNEDNTQLGTSELMDILRKGSSALSRSDEAMDLGRFLSSPIGDILNASRTREGARDAKIKQEIGSVKQEVDEMLLHDAEEEERRLLSGIAQVQSRLFEGKVIHRTQDNFQIAQEWRELQKRAHIDRTVIIDGIPVIAEHLGQDSDPSEVTTVAPKRQRKKYDWEDWCIYCRDGGELVLCTSCPRVFHAKCHGVSRQQVQRSLSLPCSQHSCATCDRNTQQAGGMLFRCQTCPQAFCEDCLPNGELDVVGDVLPEFLLLGYGETSSAYFIRCHDCREYFAKHPKMRKMWEQETKETAAKLASLEIS
ncbi:hypothetical protein SERLADRAFT_434683 [Serpula lacrymans var. lacrymans S7.9]|uniref:Uncharacterized protein n=1 Tax=Serpula lacrymans var. lacrymans (strain S7.9) TaxID=578457 RepID=F8NKL5_SERL9|nr:uncharacterized protein SERLADRAFT_434683 [Serpula lacrymans var. lacrymans S7.9]EGO28787.1 hypothetical protein SERLADRAFT_434683 [Serpula lacrymans var. lacrymans S7.9]